MRNTLHLQMQLPLFRIPDMDDARAGTFPARRVRDIAPRRTDELLRLHRLTALHCLGMLHYVLSRTGAALAQLAEQLPAAAGLDAALAYRVRA
ncbi:MAG: hypothetical protein ACK4ZJ_18350 [Allorhizobium sp.]